MNCPTLAVLLAILLLAGSGGLEAQVERQSPTSGSLVSSQSPGAVRVENAAGEVFAQLRALKMMHKEETYELEAGGKRMRAECDAFLRSRTPQEILSSNLSSGCGDYAMAFYSLMAKRGFKLLLIDSAEISLNSLESHFAGHVVVAVRDEVTSSWVLADPTARKILSRNWSPSDKMFKASGRVYWIGYCGELERYPVHSPEQLQKFYTRTLASVPPDVLNQSFARLDFIVDPSLVGESKEYLNPNLKKLLEETTSTMAGYGIHPTREVSVRLVRGDNDANSTITRLDQNNWSCRVGLKSSCSPSFIDYIERSVAEGL